ncbi:hypothetical protein B842_00060 [Corynebacterium humireducens NBRC 106098 = DSM 45392]|uniref:Uncharacterized protein n=1 Tax=Corynebacterium humireducens NBRC 106098 = DSM 45392 TaxID=1223515 RepID=A0A0B5D4I4_9CORY|nr:hypothetical protein [Corynebacterium humireducens]AJE31872.1 hypothetical protein B842_00060 [Corynebacterium humireducens NBRC 106098 = DSM 45392]
MAFKRYAALLAGSALIGSLTFVQPAMAQEAAEPTQCVRTVQETIQVAKAGTVENPFRGLFGSYIQVRSADVAGIPDAELVNGNARVLQFTVPEDIAAGDYTVTLTSLFGTTATRTLTVTLEDKTVDKEEKFDCATITVGDVTVTTGKTATVEADVEDGATELTLNAPEGLGVTVRDNGETIDIDATDAEVKTYTVPFTYKAEGTNEEQEGSFQVTVVAQVVQTINDVTVTEGGDVSRDLTLTPGVSELKFTETHGLEITHENDKLTVNAGTVAANDYEVKFTYKADGEDKNGTFKVTVEKKADEDDENEVTQTIDDVTVIEGDSKTVDLTLADGVTELQFTETHGLEVKREGDKLTVIAGDVKPGEYTVDFTYKVDGDDEAKKGSFKVTVKAETDEDEDKDEPKENASSKASSNFRDSFKGLSSK